MKLVLYGVLLISMERHPLMYAAERKDIESCSLLKEKVATASFNKVKSYLGSLARGHKELELLFGVAYEVVPILQEVLASQENTDERSYYEGVLNDQEVEYGNDDDDNELINQLSELGTTDVYK